MSKNSMLDKYKVKSKEQEEKVKEAVNNINYEVASSNQNKNIDNKEDMKDVTVNVYKKTRDRLKKFSVLNDKTIIESFEEAVEDLLKKYDFKG